jgi:para-aminobenzoate synthetase/4-amino-4-deoxychorismate lyase
MEKLEEIARNEQAPVLATVLVGRDGQAHTDTSPAPAWHSDPDGAAVLIGATATRQVSSQNVFLFHQTTNRRVADTLSRDFPHADVVVVCNERDEVAGALVGNVAARFGDEWVTPPIGAGTAPTAFRDRLIETGGLVERTIYGQDLVTADEVAVIDDVHGWRIVGLVE